MKRKRSVEITGCLDEAGQTHYDTCELFLKFAIAIYIVRMIAGVVNIVYAGLQPDVAITEKGGYWVFDLLVGISRIGPDYLPAGTQIIDNRVLTIGFLLTAMAVDFTPMFFVLNYIRNILRTIDTSHSPFVPEVVSNIRKAGRTLILIGVFSKLILKIMVQLLACHSLYSFGIPDDLQLSWIFAGVIVLLVSDIFRRGCELQQFSDETL